MIGWFVVSIALAGDGGDVVREVAAGVEVNWTDLTLNASGIGGTGGTEGRKAIEQLARREVEVSMRQGSSRIQVTTHQTLRDLELLPELADALGSRVSRWVVTEARYYASGKVELDGQLSLQDLLKPYTLKTSVPMPARDIQPDFTGLVVDARGRGVVPAWAPRILGQDGEVLHAGGVWDEQAVTVSPVVYVSDPAHSRARRAGDKPFIVVAESASGPDLVLSADDAGRFKEAMVGAAVLGEGTVVIVVDP